MKNVVLECAECNKQFDKARKEHTRQLKKNPNRKFFCSRMCSGKQSHEHLAGLNWFTGEEPFHERAIAAAREANTIYTEEERPLYELLRRCQKRKKVCDLDLSYLKELWEAQDGRCALTNIPIFFGATDYVHMPSIDRRDSGIGYLKGNVQFVSCSINYAKSKMDDQRIHDLVYLILEHYIDTRPTHR
jgi:hypothetical protein